MRSVVGLFTGILRLWVSQVVRRHEALRFVELRRSQGPRIWYRLLNTNWLFSHFHFSRIVSGGLSLAPTWTCFRARKGEQQYSDSVGFQPWQTAANAMESKSCLLPWSMTEALRWRMSGGLKTMKVLINQYACLHSQLPLLCSLLKPLRYAIRDSWSLFEKWPLMQRYWLYKWCWRRKVAKCLSWWITVAHWNLN